MRWLNCDASNRADLREFQEISAPGAKGMRVGDNLLAGAHLLRDLNGRSLARGLVDHYGCLQGKVQPVDAEAVFD